MLNTRLGVLVGTLAGLCLATGCDDEVQSGTPDAAGVAGQGGAGVAGQGGAGVAGQAGDAGALSDAGPDSDAGLLPPEASPDVSPDASLPSGVIQVLTLDDFHGQLEPLAMMTGEEVTWYGGLGYLSAYFKEARAKYPNTLILNSGDEVGIGPALTFYATDLPDEPSVLSLNLLGLTASCLGNHNFDHGTSHLEKLMNMAQYAYLGVNVSDPNKELGDKLVTSYRMIELGDADPKLKVAIIGIANPDTPTTVLAGQLGSVSISDPVAAANEAAATARAAGAHVVLGIAHFGNYGADPADPDHFVGPLTNLAGDLKGFDYLQGGHTSKESYEQLGDTLVVQGPARGHAFYTTLITVTDGKVTGLDLHEVPVIGKKRRPLEPNPGVPAGSTLDCTNATCPSGFTCLQLAKPVCEQLVMQPDPAADSLVEGWKNALSPKFEEQIGTIENTWIRDGERERSKESPLGDLVADSMLEAGKPQGGQIALFTAGTLRDPLPSSYVPKAQFLPRLGCTSAAPCDLVLGDVYNVIPGGFAVVARDLTGAVIWKMLEHSVYSLPGVNDGSVPTNYDRRFLQVAGLKFTWKTGAQPGSRVQSVYLVEGSTETAILNDDSTTYKVLVTDFMNGGADGYTMLVEPAMPPPLTTLAEAVVNYIKKKGTLTGGNPPTFDRIMEIP